MYMLYVIYYMYIHTAHMHQNRHIYTHICIYIYVYTQVCMYAYFSAKNLKSVHLRHPQKSL